METFSWFIVCLGLIGTWITGKHYWGWLIAVVFQILWTTYALSIEAQALAVQSIIFGLIALRNYFVGRQNSEQ